MDQLEGYLQCFDEKDRDIVNDKLNYYLRLYGGLGCTLFQFMLSNAIHLKNTIAFHKLIDMRPKEYLTFHPEYRFYDETIQLAYDRGIRFYIVLKSDQPKLQQFLRCRDCARMAAIAVMGCFSYGRSAKGACGATAAKKDVGRIIGRAIWESRGIKEWMK